MSENVTIQINLNSGELMIQAPAESIDTVFDKLEAFLPKIVKTHVPSEQKIEPELLSNDVDEHVDGHLSECVETPHKSVSRRKRSASSKKPESYDIVELGLSETQRIALRSFYSEKNPKSQNEQLLVIMCWLKNNANKDAVSKDEIYTALKTVDAKIPTRISSVLSNLSIDGKITSDSSGYRIHHTGEDFVKFNLPKKEG